VIGEAGHSWGGRSTGTTVGAAEEARAARGVAVEVRAAHGAVVGAAWGRNPGGTAGAGRGATCGSNPGGFVNGEGLSQNWMILLGHRRLQFIGEKPLGVAGG
jgi:hypothetical protein